MNYFTLLWWDRVSLRQVMILRGVRPYGKSHTLAEPLQKKVADLRRAPHSTFSFPIVPGGSIFTQPSVPVTAVLVQNVWREYCAHQHLDRYVYNRVVLPVSQRGPISTTLSLSNAGRARRISLLFPGTHATETISAPYQRHTHLIKAWPTGSLPSQATR